MASFSDYELIRELGRGGMGVVHLARDRTLDRHVALKQLTWLGPIDADARARFQREAQAVARLQHPNVVPIHALGEQDGQPFFVMEWVEGESLADRLRRGPLPAEEATLLVATLARAVAEAHSAGIVHRDIKPANVLLRAQDGAPMLTDFGLAKDLSAESERLTRTGDLVGTPAYMAPEQASGSGKGIGAATDVYALGATLYAALTGRPPFGDGPVINLLHAILSTAPPPPSKWLPVDPGLEAICLRCLAKAPEDRFPTATALADALTAWRPGSRRSGNRPALAVLGVALVCGAVALLSRVVPTSDPSQGEAIDSKAPIASTSSAPPESAREPRALDPPHHPGGPLDPWFLVPEPRAGSHCFLPRGRLAVRGDAQIRIWDLTGAKASLLRSMARHERLHEFPLLADGERLVFLDPDNLSLVVVPVSGGPKKTIALPDGAKSLVGDGRGRVWVGLSRGQVVQIDLAGEGASLPLEPSLAAAVSGLALSPDGLRLAGYCDHTPVYPGRPTIATWTLPERRVVAQTRELHRTTAVAWLGRGELAVGNSSGQLVFLRESDGGFETGTVLRDPKLDPFIPLAHPNVIRSLAVLADGRVLSLSGVRDSAEGSQLKLWSPGGELLTERSLERSGSPLALSLDPKQETLAVLLAGRGVELRHPPASAGR